MRQDYLVALLLLSIVVTTSQVLSISIGHWHLLPTKHDFKGQEYNDGQELSAATLAERRDERVASDDIDDCTHATGHNADSVSHGKHHCSFTSTFKKLIRLPTILRKTRIPAQRSLPSNYTSHKPANKSYMRSQTMPLLRTAVHNAAEEARLDATQPKIKKLSWQLSLAPERGTPIRNDRGKALSAFSDSDDDSPAAPSPHVIAPRPDDIRSFGHDPPASPATPLPATPEAPSAHHQTAFSKVIDESTRRMSRFGLDTLASDRRSESAQHLQPSSSHSPDGAPELSNEGVVPDSTASKASEEQASEHATIGHVNGAHAPSAHKPKRRPRLMIAYTDRQAPWPHETIFMERGRYFVWREIVPDDE